MPNNIETENRDEITKEMLENGVQYGRAKRFTNPKLKDYLLKSNKTVEIFDVVKTLAQLDQIADFLANLIQEQKTILFVGVQPAAAEPIQKISQVLNQPFLVFKWIGGFLTNFATVKTRIKFLEELREKRESGEIDSYPPVEKHRVLRELQKMENIYAGVTKMTKLPDAIFTVNLEYKPHRTMQREAKRLNIPIVGICGSDNDPDQFKIFAAANDKAPKSISWIIEYLMTKLTPVITESNLNSDATALESEQRETDLVQKQIDAEAIETQADLINPSQSGSEPSESLLTRENNG